jgi:hypothetical protein
MAGHGAYARQSQTQHGAAAIGLPSIAPAIAGAGLGPGDEPLLIADFGAAQGTNSLAPIGFALDAIAATAGERPVFVVHADIVGNDFTTLASTLETSPERYTLAHPGALPLMAGRSLYGPVLPAGSLSFAWTASTLHWLSEAPGPVHGHFFVQLSADEAAKAVYAERSAADWTAFLDARAGELVPGGAVVIVDVAMDAEGLMGSEALFDALNDALQQRGEEGVLSDAELDRIVYPTWFRSEGEMRAPFGGSGIYETPAGGGIELRELRLERLPDPFDPDGDAGEYARGQAGFLSGFLGPSFAAALDPDRGAPDREAALERVWAVARELIAADPRAVSPDYQLVALTLVKQA